MTRLKPQKPISFCVGCDSESSFREVFLESERFFKGKLLLVVSPTTICGKCGLKYLMDGQLDQLIKNTRDQYEKFN